VIGLSFLNQVRDIPRRFPRTSRFFSASSNAGNTCRLTASCVRKVAVTEPLTEEFEREPIHLRVLHHALNLPAEHFLVVEFAGLREREQFVVLAGRTR